MQEERIAEAVRRILGTLPAGVMLVAAAKGRTVEQVRAAIGAGVAHVGHNYLQDAEAMIPLIPERVTWHMIGHLQTNKVKKAVEIFDMIETVDSLDLAREIDKRAATAGKTMPVLIEINSGEEGQKTGVRPDDAEGLIRAISPLPRVRIQGLMTMGPFEGDPEDSRPYFRLTRSIFGRIAALAVPGVEMRVLSMGMTNSYRVAVEEGATRVRIGTLIFGPRV